MKRSSKKIAVFLGGYRRISHHTQKNTTNDDAKAQDSHSVALVLRGVALKCVVHVHSVTCCCTRGWPIKKTRMYGSPARDTKP